MWSDIRNVSYIELHICNQASCDHRSYERKKREKKPKKSGLQRGLNPWLSQPTELTGYRSIYKLKNDQFWRIIQWSILAYILKRLRQTARWNCLFAKTRRNLIYLSSVLVCYLDIWSNFSKEWDKLKNVNFHAFMTRSCLLFAVCRKRHA